MEIGEICRENAKKTKKNSKKLKWVVLKNEKGGAAWHFSAPKIKGPLTPIFPDVIFSEFFLRLQDFRVDLNGIFAAKSSIRFQ